MFLLYNLVLTFLAPLWVPAMWWRAKRRKEQPNWKERMGEPQIPGEKGVRRVWIHAVSVGEVIAAIPILRELRVALPKHEVVLSVTTSSGHQTAREQAKDFYDHLIYFPIDVARFQLSAMQRVRPEVVAVMETELWFNFLWAAKVFDAKTLLINGRISDRSFRRSKPFAFFYRALLSNVDLCLMQTEADAERIKALGARSADVLGNTKFDQAVLSSASDPREWREQLNVAPETPVIVVGSTRGEEEERFVLEALKGIEKVAIVHAPRHIERAPELVKAVERTFGAVALRSKGETGPYLVLDTYGELDKVYSIADIVIIGGGFANLGGQNLVQPLAHGKPVLHGPHMQNFRHVAATADQEQAAIRCDTPAQLRAEIDRLLGDPLLRAKMGHAAKALVYRNVGASYRYAQAIAEEAEKV